MKVWGWILGKSRGRTELGLKICSCRNGAHSEPQLHFGHLINFSSGQVLLS
ncbi:unnamed protein product [Moneuplotes crassus]|uniref:Uncharacterized protein n=1 Tax=Euplotes crassus TaxID=5936 RepID=A0AAD1X7X3_EUPCR|nr:unnamed protein product [Moneuplotes crassus]